MNWIDVKALNTLVLGVGLLIVAGCSSSLTKPVLETDGEEMIDIYRNALENGKSVDDQLDADSADADKNAVSPEKDEQAAREARGVITEPRPSTPSVGHVDPAVLAQHGSRQRKYKIKAYTEYNGKYYHKATGTEIIEFHCGLLGKAQPKPCPGKYGFGRNMPIQSTQAEKALASTAKKGASTKAVTPEELIAKDQAEIAKRQAKALGDVAAVGSAAVKRAQHLLTKGGFIIGSIDGVLGKKTSEALRSFQVQNGLPATGTLAAATVTALEQDFGGPVYSVTSQSVQHRTPTQSEPCGAHDLYCGYSRTPDNEIQQLFPRLANPDIIVYVTPHLATHNKVPVPGYTTAFPLYDEVHYAMPGEQVRQ